MKTFKLFIAAVVTFLLFFSGCIVTFISVTNPAAVAKPSKLSLISAGLLGIYEIVVRIIPSVGDYSVVSWIIKALKLLSDTLNNTPQ